MFLRNWQSPEAETGVFWDFDHQKLPHYTYSNSLRIQFSNNLKKLFLSSQSFLYFHLRYILVIALMMPGLTIICNVSVFPYFKLIL